MTAVAPSPTVLAGARRNMVPAPRSMAGIRQPVAVSATVPGAASCRPSPQVTETVSAPREPRSDQSAPVPATPVEDGPECAAVAYVEALDGSERTVLLRHIAAAYPEVVAAGAELVEQWRAECAESRRANAKRRRREQRRRHRAAAGNRGDQT